MKDLLQEATALREAAEHAQKVADSYNDTEPDCDCAVEHRKLAGWLAELLEIKKARLSLEVFLEQGYDLLPDEPEASDDTPIPCFRCGGVEGLQEQGGSLVCLSCGAININKEKSQI